MTYNNVIDLKKPDFLNAYPISQTLKNGVHRTGVPGIPDPNIHIAHPAFTPAFPRSFDRSSPIEILYFSDTFFASALISVRLFGRLLMIQKKMISAFNALESATVIEANKGDAGGR